jgi:HSP20 family protein
MSLTFYTPFAVNHLFAEPKSRTWTPAIDIKETENELIFKADVPGIEMKDIDVSIENGRLTLRGERQIEADGWYRVERSFGKFERVFALPDTINPEGVKADYKNGTLTITLPKKELAKPRQIKVEIAN